MYAEHPIFRPPPEEAVLWRYMDFTKFVSLLSTNALYFARADTLGDPFEGSLTKHNRDLRPLFLQSQGLGPDKLPDALQNITAALQEAPKYSLVNCWHENTYESEAMWKIYAREKDGIAIKTTFKRLRESFVCEETIYIGTVTYVDYENAYIAESDLFTPVLHKRKSFEHEREVRAIKSNFSPPGVPMGAYCNVELKSLIAEVIIAPQAPTWFAELVKSVANKYELQAPITTSSLAVSPIW